MKCEKCKNPMTQVSGFAVAEKEGGFLKKDAPILYACANENCENFNKEIKSVPLES